VRFDEVQRDVRAESADAVRVAAPKVATALTKVADRLGDHVYALATRGVPALARLGRTELHAPDVPHLPHLPRPSRALRPFTVITTCALFLAALVGTSAVIGGAAVTDFSKAVEARSADLALGPLPQRTAIYGGDGALLTVMDAGENRVIVPLSSIPQVLVNAVIDIEDSGFWTHEGVDVEAIARAADHNVRAGAVRQGGSTITQQLAKAELLSPDRTLARKLSEVILARRLEAELGKRGILERYLNRIYLGEGASGVATAAETYFAKPVDQLGVPEAALIAGLIKNPTGYNPLRDPEAAGRRRALVLDAMVTHGHLAAAEAEAAKAAPLPTQANHPPERGGYVVDAAVQELLADSHLGATLDERRRTLLTSGLHVYTTIDPHLQDAGERAVAAGIPKGYRISAALAAVDPATGAVRAIVGGPDYGSSQFNVAVSGSGRQTGSSFKVFTLVAALQKGRSPDDVIDGRAPCPIPNPGGKPNPWKPENYEGAAGGPVSLTEATAKSVNCAYARLAMDVGPKEVARVAHDMGITADLAPVPSITLGTNSVPPLQMASAYATLAADGVARKPHVVQRVLRSDGTAMLENGSDGTQVLDQQVSRLATSMLTSVVTGGTGTAAALADRPVAGKTGTAQSYHDAWFVGFTPQLATAVWMGNVDGEVPMRNVGGRNVTGGSYPTRIWHDFMATAMTGQPVMGFPAPVPRAPTVIAPLPTTVPVPTAPVPIDPARGKGRGHGNHDG
jgi:penicillin-binding protein 1A